MSTYDEKWIARRFNNFGWLGMWVQAALAILPLVMLGYMLVGKATGTRVTLNIMDYLAFVGLAILLFTTFWSFRYTRLSRRIANPELRPEWTSVAKTLRFGLWVGCIGVAASLLLIIIEVVRLLFLFLKTPQAGVPVIQTQAQSRTEWVSAMDVVSLLAEICTLAGELLVIALTLWLLFIVLQHVGVFGRLDDSSRSAGSKS